VQPDRLDVSVIQDSAMFCKNSTTTVTVNATGGNMPYSGTGSVVAGPGFKTYYVTDARGCTAQKGYTVSNGINAAPGKPAIDGTTKVNQRQSNVVFSISGANSNYIYNWTVPQDAQIVSGQNTPSITVNWGSTADNVTATAINMCGTSAAASKKVNVTTKALKDNNELNSSIAPGTANNSLVLLPNPVNSIATLNFYAQNSYEYTIRITDISGRTLLMKKGIATTLSNQVKLDVSRFTAGIYFITIVNNDGEMKTVKMIKE
jgi:hypothetical protein